MKILKVLEGWKTTHGSYIPNTLENDLIGRKFPCDSEELEIRQNFIEIHFNLEVDEEFSMKLQHIEINEGYGILSNFFQIQSRLKFFENFSLQFHDQRQSSESR